jgi:hypothetical protein
MERPLPEREIISTKGFVMNRTLDRRNSLGANWVNVALGIWVIISPFVLGFAHLQAVMWNDVAVGIAVALFALSRSPNHRGGEPLNVVLGVWLILSAFVFGVAAAVPFWNSIILGIVIALAALFANVQSVSRVPTNPPNP